MDASGRSRASLGALITRVEAEFPGRILIGPDDYHRWTEEADGLCWAVIGVGGFDGLIRSDGDLDRLPSLFERGVRVFQLASSASSVWAGDDQGLSDLGRAFVRRLAGLSTDRSPLLDLAGLSDRATADVLSAFEEEWTPPQCLLPFSSQTITGENLARLRAVGGVVGFRVGGEGVCSADDLKRSIEATAEIPYFGRPGYEGIAIATDFNGLDRIVPGLSNVAEVSAWVMATFGPEVAAAILHSNAHAFLARATGSA